MGGSFCLHHWLVCHCTCVFTSLSRVNAKGDKRDHSLKEMCHFIGNLCFQHGMVNSREVEKWVKQERTSKSCGNGRKLPESCHNNTDTQFKIQLTWKKIHVYNLKAMSNSTSRIIVPKN